MKATHQMQMPIQIPAPWWLARLMEQLGMPAAAGRQSARLKSGATGSTSVSVSTPMQYPAGISGAHGDNANVVEFPAGGRNALARLAHELGAALDDHVGGHAELKGEDRMLLTLTTTSTPRLWIDSTAHVEHFEGLQQFRVVLGEHLDARISLETRHYEKAKQFAWEYLLATQVCCAKGEAS